jgi:hypothetical protein
MKRILLTLGLFLVLTQSASASYVQGGFGANATQISTTCNINSGSGSVTAGHMEIFSPLANGGSFASITSTRVPTWTQVGGFGSQNGIWWGIATSSGAEAIVFSLTGSTQLASVCAEYTENTIDVSNTTTGPLVSSISVTTTKPVVTLVCVPWDSHATAFSAFTQRQTSNGNLILIGDQGQTSTGTYSCALTTSMNIVLLAIYTPTPANVRRHR